jgi:hypothetical protein
MNEFDRRWQDCAARARQEELSLTPVPVGLATRAWARWLEQSNSSLAAAWTALSWRALVAATIVLAILALAELRSAPAGRPLAPHLEDVVTNVWRSI